MSKTRPTARRAGHAAIVNGALSHRFGKALFQALSLGTAGHTDAARLTVERAPTSVAPAWFANAHAGDAAMKEQLRTLYETCLKTYRDAVRPQDAALRVDDAGAALAFFVAANLYALHGVEPSPEIQQRLEEQLASMARRNSAWESASIAERQLYFEQMAVLGVLVAGMFKRAGLEGPAARAHVRDAARGYMFQMLGINPDLLTLGSEGLALRSAQTRRAAA
jgi:hypothetical protein